MREQDADARSLSLSALPSEVRKRAIHAPILAHTIATADASPLKPLLLLACEEQPRRTLHERVKHHPTLVSSRMLRVAHSQGSVRGRTADASF